MSNNGDMALEDADLLTRQPKVCPTRSSSLRSPTRRIRQAHGINQWAAPNIGQGFLTATLFSGGLAAAVPPGPPTIFDHCHLVAPGGNSQVLGQARTWNTRFAGVVAADGADVITLENYARNTEDALAGTDTRYERTLGGQPASSAIVTSPRAVPPLTRDVP